MERVCNTISHAALECYGEEFPTRLANSVVLVLEAVLDTWDGEHDFNKTFAVQSTYIMIGSRQRLLILPLGQQCARHPESNLFDLPHDAAFQQLGPVDHAAIH